MKYSDDTYGNEVAGIYDSWYSEVDNHAIERLTELTGDGRALELGIGTGRIAVPLAARGVRVEGIDASPAMVERLRAKPGGAQINVSLGDFSDVQVEGSFRLIYVVFNTL